MRMLLVCAAVAAVAAGLVAMEASGQGSAPGPTVQHFYVRFVGETGGDPTHIRPGKTVTARSTVFDKRGGRRLGRTSELCTETIARPFTLQCSFSAILNSGSFTVEGGFNPTKTPYRAALVGGTGQFAGAHGTLLSTSAKGQAESWTISYSTS